MRAAFILCVACIGPAFAADRMLLLDPEVGRVTLGGEGQYWIDPTGSAGIDQVAGPNNIGWRPTSAGMVHRLRPGKALWLRFTLGETDDSQRWWLEVPYSAVDRVTVYAADSASRWIERTAGDTLAVASWPVPHRHPVLPLALTPGSSQEFFVRIENTVSFSAPLVFTSERELLRQEQRTALFLGIYFGLVALSVVLAAATGVWLRDAVFGWYGLAVSLMGLSQAAVTGVAGLHLWPTNPWWNNVSVVALPIAAVAVLLSFLSALVSLPQRSKRLHLLFSVLSAVCLAVAALVLVAEPGMRMRLMVPTVLIAVVSGIAVLAWAAMRGDRHAGWLLMGMLPMGIGASLPMARALGLLSVGFWTTNGMLLGIAVDLPILLMVLGLRAQDRVENTRRIHRFQRIDPATGLVNAQVFQARLARLIARSTRLKQESLVLLIDVVNAEQIRRDFDRRAAEELPLRVASRLLSFAREIDTVARLSEHRFGVLVEGPLVRQEALGTGAKVIARCLMPFEGKPLDWVPQVRVAQGFLPGAGEAQLVVDKLGAMLAMAPADSRRAVFTLGA
ncbi:sensor domain-containing diguanylate cyclase [Ramlibacter sp. MMS24-I3-19]|uniref:sensor domain-containing diguanylate cyclase n=1 Tax=Ramlibacter sp. MMS24-I3-19 TaxID=3416606 RepID=UPI003D05593B